jgi:hypothetical protein
MVGWQNPDRAILVAGRPHVQELKIETVADMYAGRIVKKGTTDADMQAGTAGCTPLGVLGWEQTNAKHRPALISTIYLVNALAAVLSGPMIVKLLLSTDTVVKGDALVAGANGKVRKASALSVTVPAGGTTVTSDAAQPNLVEAGSTMPGGPILAYAEESQDASGGDKAIIAKWVL